MLHQCLKSHLPAVYLSSFAVSCPNKCSGNGVCKALKDLNTTVPYSVNNWDANRIMGCQCDPGYFGHDCSQRELFR